MKKVIVYTTVLLLVTSLRAFTQDGQPMNARSADSASKKEKKEMPEKWVNFFKRLSLRQSFQGKLEKEEAAFLNLVYPKGKENSYNFSVALGYNVFHPDLSLVSLRPFMEWQKNSLSEKEQDVITGGLSLQAFLWDVIEKNRGWVPLVFSNLNYKKDAVKETKGMQVSLYISPIVNGRGGKFHPLPDVVMENAAFSFVYNVYTGLEYENRAQAAVESHEGSVLRWYNRVTVNFYPAPFALDKRLEIIPDFSFRKALSNNSEAEMDENKIFKLSCNLVLLKKEVTNIADVKVGFDYVSGVDPTKGFEKQKMKSVTFKIKI